MTLNEKISIQVQRSGCARPITNARLYPSACAQDIFTLSTAFCAELDKPPSLLYSTYSNSIKWQQMTTCQIFFSSTPKNMSVNYRLSQFKFSQNEWRGITVKIRSFYQTTIERYFCISSFSNSDRENLPLLNFIQIYLFLLYRSSILDPYLWISELWTLIYNQ